MKQVAATLKDFDLTYGWIIRWLMLIGIGYAVMYADTRYLKRGEVETYMVQLHEMRKDDIAQIYDQIAIVRKETVDADRVVRSLEIKISRIEEQNKTISAQLDRLLTREFRP